MTILSGVSWAHLLEGRAAVLLQNVDVRDLLNKVEGHQNWLETEVHGPLPLYGVPSRLDTGALLANSRPSREAQYTTQRDAAHLELARGVAGVTNDADGLSAEVVADGRGENVGRTTYMSGSKIAA